MHNLFWIGTASIRVLSRQHCDLCVQLSCESSELKRKTGEIVDSLLQLASVKRPVRLTGRPVLLAGLGAVKQACFWWEILKCLRLFPMCCQSFAYCMFLLLLEASPALLYNRSSWLLLSSCCTASCKKILVKISTYWACCHVYSTL